MQHDPSTDTQLATSPERTEKRLSTLEKDKMRLWKMQNDQRAQIDHLTQQMATLNQTQNQHWQQTDQHIHQDKDNVDAHLAQLSRTLKRTRRLLYLTVILLLLVCIHQIDWPLLSQASQSFRQFLQTWMAS